MVWLNPPPHVYLILVRYSTVCGVYVCVLFFRVGVLTAGWSCIPNRRALRCWLRSPTNITHAALTFSPTQHSRYRFKMPAWAERGGEGKGRVGRQDKVLDLFRLFHLCLPVECGLGAVFKKKKLLSLVQCSADPGRFGSSGYELGLSPD